MDLESKLIVWFLYDGNFGVQIIQIIALKYIFAFWNN